MPVEAGAPEVAPGRSRWPGAVRVAILGAVIERVHGAVNFNLLQILVFSFGLLLLLSTWYAYARGRAGLGEAIRWSLLWSAICFFALMPHLSNKIARKVGIDSGRFLVLYIAVIVLFACLVLLYARTRKLSREITQLVREIAIQRGHEALDDPESQDSSRDPEADRAS